MPAQKLVGTGVALITPFNEALEIDFTGLKRLLDSTAEKGVDYYVVMGTTGESATLDKNEKKKILDFACANNAKQLPIIYGIGGNNTKEIIEQISDTDLTAVDAVLSVSPYYNKPSQEGIYEHYLKIADHSPVPIILYNVPGRTGSNISAETTIRLSEHDNIIGTKEASGDISQALTIIKHKADDFLLISGDDLLTISLHAIGAIGVISVLANAFADIFNNIMEHLKTSDYQSATQEVLKLTEINPLMYEQSNPVGIKQVLMEQGICENYVRLPLVPCTVALKEKIQHCMTLFEGEKAL
ncbi:4-hydroxy-tetrahydrodipicolinate synthase [Fulvivirga sp. M361]|uniref:4-hydroxy-tetrahydrodipicolinate synthase n=1 Tax=Fulvivirga sp. M361 TaxID=2594266 RepID=UPI00117B4640|nr:4-hydroxy-tetrahydrodipicolinate synthase [Fulvivirga sp. M361]TRX60857.1 4-hydroxy-tetrahydrodipicolinate synthase [Fulvivirga sp. M361]